MSNTAVEQQSDYVFETISIESDRLEKPIEIKGLVSDVEIFEHLDKPYLTGSLVFLDDADIIQNVDILGAEKIQISLRSTRPGSTTIDKTFYIDSIGKQTKANDNSKIASLNLIEDIGYISMLFNINRSYSGKCSNLIKSISSNFLGKTVDVSDTDKQSFKVIIPNLDPLDSMKWISNRASTNDGYPFYLFSTLVEKNLKFTDLGTMLQNEVINPDISYKKSNMVQKATSRDVRRRTIKNFTFNSSENLSTLIYHGLVGSQYQYIDTTKNKTNDFAFDIIKDLLKPISGKGVLKTGQKQYTFSEDYKHAGVSFNKYKSRTISQIGGSSAFKDAEDVLSFNESVNAADYKLDIICRAMDGILKKTPLTITVPGVDFIDGESHCTVGNNLRIEFPSTTPESKDNKGLDTKSSGDYLIFAARHMFKKEVYDLTLECVKMANYDT